MKNLFNIVTRLSPALLLAACAYQIPQAPAPDDPRYAPVWPGAQAQSSEVTGSIYRPATAMNLYQRRAYRLGDVLTINLNEATSARKSSGTSFSRESSNNVADMTLFGANIETNTSLSNGSEFDGAANSDQSNQLQGNITVTVTDVLPNGLLEVRGEKWLELNQDREFIRISGLVRKEDIAPDNTIASTRVADVRIAYSGTGTLADTNSPGALSRFFVSRWWPL